METSKPFSEKFMENCREASNLKKKLQNPEDILEIWDVFENLPGGEGGCSKT